MYKTNRRKFFGRGLAVAAATAVAAEQAPAQQKLTKRVIYKGGKKPDSPPLFSPAVAYGNLLFISGAGAHFQGDIKAHTKKVLDDIQAQLEDAGSSMDKCLKCNVYLNDIKDWDAMNEVFKGRFGAEPPVRTTVAPAGGIPGGSLVEIDVIAYI